jgi:hypothetical protein
LNKLKYYRLLRDLKNRCDLGWLGRHWSRGELAMDVSPETAERFACALGQAVVRNWSHLPEKVQERLFEEAVTSQGEAMRSRLAVFLYGKHTGISGVVDAHGIEIQEPDSLGG